MKNNLKYLFYIIITVLLIIFLKDVDYNKLISNVTEINLWVLLFLIFIQLITQLLIAIQWTKILGINSYKISVMKMFFINTKSSVIEAITPGTKIGGEAYKTVILRNQLKCSFEKAASLVAVQKIISFTGLLFFILLSLTYLVVTKDIDLISDKKYMLMGVISFVFVGLIYLYKYPEKVAKLFRSKNKILQKFSNFMNNYEKSINNIKKEKRDVAIQIIMTLMIWFLFPIKSYIIVLALNLDVSLFMASILTFSAYVVGTVSITPGGLGTFELTMSTLMILLTRTSKEEALLAASLFRIITFWFVVSTGVILMYLEKLIPIKEV